MDRLPVDSLLPELCTALSGGGAAVLVSPTGSGKSTRVAPALLDVVDPDHAVLLLQPRRVAARMLAARIAQERGVRLGEQVGYRVRFDSRVGRATRLELLTEGLLTRRLLDDPFLDGSGGWGRPVGAVLLDELHERSLHTDLALAMLRELRDAREELVVVAMSATLDAGPVAAFLDARTFLAEGRSFPVAVTHQGPDLSPGDRDLPTRVAAAVRQVLAAQGEGDVLVFLPGAWEIGACMAQLTELGPGVGTVALHGRLPPREQDRALQPAAQLGLRRKVVLATNIAETSLTLPGVRAVIDSGLARQPVLDPATGLERLETVLVSRASADQRAGRAGRTAPGTCLRLWSQFQHQRRAEADPPEIARLDLTSTALAAHAWTGDPGGLCWLEAPPAAAWASAVAGLQDIGAVADGHITATGRRLMTLPTDPRLGRVLLAAAEAGHAATGAALIALLSEADPWGRGGPGAEERVEAVLGGRGHGAEPRALARVRQAAEQLARSVDATIGRPAGPVRLAPLLPALLAGLPGRLGRMRGDGRRLKLANGRGAELARGVATPPGGWLFALQLRARQPGEDLVTLALGLDEAQVGALPTQQRRRTEWVAERGAAVGVVETAFGALVLRRIEEAPDPVEAAALLEAAAADDPARALQPGDEGRGLVHRVLFLREHRPDLPLPPWDSEDGALRALLPTLCVGRRSLQELGRADVDSALAGQLDWQARAALDRLAPARWTLPTGSTARIDYDPAVRHGGSPVLRARVQQLFGQARGPAVLDGVLPLTLELLAPNQRPLQVTSDLAGFWAGTWADVRRDLRGRYPKHAWPEDPVAASPEDRPRRRPR